jgi:urease accessory protein
MITKLFLLAVPAMLAAAPAFAHTGFHVSGFSAGALHPLTGLDHALAMVAVGLLAALLGGRALWAVPGSFVAMMLIGGALGFAGAGIPAVEIGIAASVLVLGFVVALGRTRSLGAAMALAGGFAVFHGYAHGAEIPVGAGALSYSLGFAFASAGLHLAGMAAGLVTFGRWKVARLAGAAVAVGGLVLALG